MPDLPYKKIISLVPSLTELLIDLGLKDQMIGRTRFCIHPEDEVGNIEIIGGTKSPDLEKIVDLEPDFVVANKEENRKEDIDVLQKYADVRVSEIQNIQDAILEISALGLQLGVQDQAGSMIEQINKLLKKKPSSKPLSVAYLIWKDPWMTVGHDTYIHDMLQKYDLRNIFGLQKRYPTTSLDEISSLDPSLILLSSEPYPFKEKHIEEIQAACPHAKIQLVNGEWFSWYGSRMLNAIRNLNEWRTSLLQ